MSGRFRVIDTHIHPIPALVTPKSIITELNKNNVENAVLLAMDLHHEIVDTHKFRRELEKALSYSHVFDVDSITYSMKYLLQGGNTTNEYLREAVLYDPDRFIGFGSVQLGYMSKAYVKRKLDEIDAFRFRGIKLLPTVQFYNPKGNKHLYRVFKFAQNNGLLLLLHTGCDPGPWEHPALSKNGNPSLLIEALNKFPDVKVILAHLGSYSARYPGIWLDEALSLAEQFPKSVYGDISAVPFLIENVGFSEKIRSRMGFHRILFGSDFPVVRGGLETDLGINASIEAVRETPYLSN
ncbi:MAG TPA: amidohydrolase family protein, partial [Candidatus Hodarchaeales archaeon]|nr:amidohydrolase family protein [Candidatus Hodarchaeales archaeon]